MGVHKADALKFNSQRTNNIFGFIDCSSLPTIPT